MNVVIRPAAAADIEDAYGWYSEKQSALSLEFLAAVGEALLRVSEYPDGFPRVHRDARRILLKRFPNGIFYTVMDETIVVVACMHASRDPLKWESRLNGRGHR